MNLKISPPDFVGVIDYADLNALVREVYHLPTRWNVVEDQEWYNDSYYAVRVPAPGTALDTYDIEQLGRFKVFGHSTYGLSAILADLSNRGLIAPGKYLIRVEE